MYLYASQTASLRSNSDQPPISHSFRFQRYIKTPLVTMSNENPLAMFPPSPPTWLLRQNEAGGEQKRTLKSVPSDAATVGTDRSAAPQSLPDSGSSSMMGVQYTYQPRQHQQQHQLQPQVQERGPTTNMAPPPATTTTATTTTTTSADHWDTDWTLSHVDFAHLPGPALARQHSGHVWPGDAGSGGAGTGTTLDWVQDVARSRYSSGSLR